MSQLWQENGRPIEADDFVADEYGYLKYAEVNQASSKPRIVDL